MRFHKISHHVMCGLVFSTALTLSACGGGGGGGASTPAPSASSSASSSSSSSASSSQISLYVTNPIVANCDAGVLKNSERVAVLDEVNAIRTRHGLLPITYDSTQDAAAADTALYMVANTVIAPAPSSSGLCYSTNAATFAPDGILSLAGPSSTSTQSVPTTQIIDAFLISNGESVLKTRRFILNPFLAKTTVGRVDGQPAGNQSQFVSAVLKVRNNDTTDVSAMANDFVAYPYGIYPASDFSSGWYLSFSAIASKTNAAANGSSQVSFAGATISVLNGATPLTVTNQSSDYGAYGLPNSLQWQVPGLQANVTYSVQISNVVVNGVTRQYSYTFRLQ